MAQHVEEMVLKLKDQFSKVMGDAEGKTQKVRGQVSGLEGQLKKLKRQALAAFGTFAAVSAVKGVAMLGIEMEQTRVAFTTFLGDAGKANDLIKELNEFANVTPFDNAQVIKAGKVLLAFGTPMEKIQGELKGIGDISAGTGKDFNELATIYGKARIAGTLYAEDINQLVGAGVPVISEFAKQLGVAESEVKKMASEGKLQFSNLEQAFADMTSEGGQFFNLMEKQSQTVGGQLSTLKGQLQTIGISIGEALLPTIQAVVVKVQVLTGWISKNKDQIAAWIPPILKVLGVIGGVIVAVKAWIAVQALLNFVLTANPIGIIIVVIGAAIAIFTIWREKIIDAIEQNTKLGIVLKMAFWPIIALVKGISWLYETTKEWLTTTETGQRVVANFRSQMDLLRMILGKVGDFFSDLPNKALSAFDVIEQRVSAFVDVVRAGIAILFNPFDDEARDAGLEMFKASQEKLTENAGDIYRRVYSERKQKQADAEARDAQLKSFRSAESDFASASKSGAASTGLGNISGAVAGVTSGSASGLSSVVSTAPKNVTITIGKLVEQLNLNTTNLKEGTAEIRDEITRALLTAINDSQIQAG